MAKEEYLTPVHPEVLREIARTLFKEQGADIGLWVDCGEMTKAEAKWLMSDERVSDQEG